MEDLEDRMVDSKGAGCMGTEEADCMGTEEADCKGTGEADYCTEEAYCRMA
jgi:hypothetical protein